MLETYEKAGKKGWGVALRVPILYGEGKNEESAVNVLMDSVMGQKEGKVDHWALRYPTNTEDVGRVLQGEFLFLRRMDETGSRLGFGQKKERCSQRGDVLPTSSAQSLPCN